MRWLRFKGCLDKRRRLVSLNGLHRFPTKLPPSQMGVAKHGSKSFTFDFWSLSWVRFWEEQLSIMDSSESSALSITGVLLALVLVAYVLRLKLSASDELSPMFLRLTAVFLAVLSSGFALSEDASAIIWEALSGVNMNLSWSSCESCSEEKSLRVSSANLALDTLACLFLGSRAPFFLLEELLVLLLFDYLRDVLILNNNIIWDP